MESQEKRKLRLYVEAVPSPLAPLAGEGQGEGVKGDGYDDSGAGGSRLMKPCGEAFLKAYDFLSRWRWWIFIKIPADFYVRNQEFSCKRCGFCCSTYIVYLYPEDIVRMEQRGYRNYSQQIKGRPFLRWENGACMFFQREGSQASCTIHADVRPRLCHEFPLITGPLGLKRKDSRCRAFKTPSWFVY